MDHPSFTVLNGFDPQEGKTGSSSAIRKLSCFALPIQHRQRLKLEEARYVTVKKKFVLRKPQALYRITETGRQALTEYVQALKQLIVPAIDV